MSQQLERLRAFAHELADLADSLTLPAFRAARASRSTGESLGVKAKADGTPVTEVDVEVERRLRRAIADRFPEHAVLGEEDGLDGPEHAPRWIIDPIDGTKNYVRGIPVFATLIALQRDGEEVAAVVSAPALATRWDGIAGGPARRAGAEIRVSDVPTLSAAMLQTGGLNTFVDAGYADLLGTLATTTRRQRCFGDFWQHCLVAEGACDVAVEAAVSLWDLAAVKCVVEAAGGRFTSLAGERTADGGSAVSSNGHVHDELLALFRR